MEIDVLTKRKLMLMSHVQINHLNFQRLTNKVKLTDAETFQRCVLRSPHAADVQGITHGLMKRLNQFANKLVAKPQNEVHIVMNCLRVRGSDEVGYV